jgi:hypothetical protein
MKFEIPQSLKSEHRELHDEVSLAGIIGNGPLVCSSSPWNTESGVGSWVFLAEMKPECLGFSHRHP